MSSSSLPEQRPRAFGGRTAARLAPFPHHAAASYVARPFSTPLPSCKAAPRPRIAVIPGGGRDSGRGGPFAPAQASFPFPAPAKKYFNSKFSSNGHRGVSGAPLPPRSSAGEQLPISSGVQRGKPQQDAEEAGQLQTTGDGTQQLYNNTAGSSASAPAVGDGSDSSSSSDRGGAAGQRPSSATSAAPDASAVAAARLLRGALEAALLPRLEALEGRIVEAVEGSVEVCASVLPRLEAMEARNKIMREVLGGMEERIVKAVEARVMQGLMDMEQQREEKAGARGEGKGEEQEQRSEGHGQQEEQGQKQGQQGQEQEQQGQEQGQPLAAALAAQEQRIREELKVMWARLWGRRAYAWGRSNRERCGAKWVGVQVDGDWAVG